MKTTTDAKVKTLEDAIKLDQERITDSVARINAIDGTDGAVDGYLTRDWRNPETLSLLKDSSDKHYDTYYVQFNSNNTNSGIDQNTLHLYQTYN